MSGQGLIVIVILFGLVWLLFIQPQRRRQRSQAALLDELEPGDQILTAGGLYGTVRSVDGDEVMVELAPGTEVRLARRAVAAVIPPEYEDEDQEEDDELDEDEDEDEEESPEIAAEDEVPAEGRS